MGRGTTIGRQRGVQQRTPTQQSRKGREGKIRECRTNGSKRAEDDVAPGANARREEVPAGVERRACLGSTAAEPCTSWGGGRQNGGVDLKRENMKAKIKI